LGWWTFRSLPSLGNCFNHHDDISITHHHYHHQVLYRGFLLPALTLFLPVSVAAPVRQVVVVVVMIALVVVKEV